MDCQETWVQMLRIARQIEPFQALCVPIRCHRWPQNKKDFPMFEKVSLAPADPILGLTSEFKADTNPEKINLSVGVYQDASGVTPVLASVKEAERRLVETEKSKGYLPIDGAAEYALGVQQLLLGEGSELIASGRVTTSHTPGGTGALRVAANFLRSEFPDSKLWLSAPTWPNHPKIFQAAGVTTETYAYFDRETNGLDFAAMAASLKKIPAGDVVLLHGCCHNPTGIDPTLEQWQEIAEIVSERKLLPLVDFAYQGFADGLQEDSAGLTAILAKCDELLICSSFSKNFGLYRERVGALTAISSSKEVAAAVQSQIKAGVRSNYSNPPAHGAAVVTTVLTDAALRTQWEKELAEMRERIASMRTLFVDTLKAKGVPGDFSFITGQRGMFSFSGLTPEQVERLKKEFAIYIVGSGRINVAGMTAANMNRLCMAIKSVV